MGKDFLNIILKDKKEEIKYSRSRVPENELREKAILFQKRRSFFQSMKKPGPSGINIIAEIKRASPSKGVIRKNLDPALYALAYENGGAAAISVLTDKIHFKGSADDLKKVKEVTSLPVLRKDFLMSSYQIYESIVMGADAVLLIVRILSKNQLKDYVDLCNELKIDALVEVHSEDDIETATWAGAELIGINNRNLSSFDTDINNAVRMVSLLKPNQIPVAASGIQSRNDINIITKCGISNFLIGESLVRAKNPLDFLKSLLND
ncbi:MAG: indole-3-glycerol phosphate synthase TrpC [Deltaproteobacteria bacterium]|nr:indole-3-glycerol phosphate synthase TrpC [Deltaproteobacteria bacterium]